MTIRVLLADDQPLVLAGLRTILESEPDIEIVGQAQDGRTAVALARELRPDLVLLDIRMPQLDGLAATRELAAEDSGNEPVRVVVLTTFDLDEYVYEALRAGAAASWSRTSRTTTSSPGCALPHAATRCSPRRSRNA